MKTHRHHLPVSPAVLFSLCSSLILGGGSAQAGIDLDGDEMDDVWELFFEATSLLPGEDEDADGLSNLEESKAGTNPFDRNDKFEFTSIVKLEDEFRLQWGSVAGKQYFLESGSDLVSWTMEDISHPGTGEDLAFHLPEGSDASIVGGALREVWRHVPGSQVADLIDSAGYPDSPDGIHGISKLRAPENDGEDFGARIRGYLIAPASGDYKLTLKSRHDSVLFVSRDTDPANLVRVAAVPSGPGVEPIDPIDGVAGIFNPSPPGLVAAADQNELMAPGPDEGSGTVTLEAGQLYYFEVIHKAAQGEDYCSVSWSGPGLGTANTRPIDGQYLAMWLGTLNGADGDFPLRRFHRIVVHDIDSDNDGATDWEELKVSYDPFDPESQVPGVLDGDVLKDKLTQTTNTISVEVIEPNGYEKGAGGTPKNAVMRLHRSGSLAPVTVSYSTSGLAVPGEDFVPLSGSATIPFAQDTVDVPIVPVADEHLEVPESFVLTLDSSDDYNPGSENSGTATLEDDEVQTEKLLLAQLTAQGGAMTTGSGNSPLWLSGDHTSCRIALSFSGLTSETTAAHIHQVGSGDIVEGVPHVPFTNYIWTFPVEGQGPYASNQELLDALVSGQFYLNVHTTNYPMGEIRGDYLCVEGSIEFDPPADPPDLPIYTGEDKQRDISRFLAQATFGATPALVQELNTKDFETWIDEQMDPIRYPMPGLKNYTEAADAWEYDLNETLGQQGNPAYDPNFEPNHHNRRRGWWAHVLKSDDQLRQRVAFALSEILVTSKENSRVRRAHYGHADYYDMLARNAFGSFRTVLEEVTYHPIMGVYLSSLQNAKTDLIAGTSPDENYAREVMQLFSIGLLRLHPDGTLKLNPTTGLPDATYDNFDITGMAKVMTGLSFSKRVDQDSEGNWIVSDNNSFYYYGGPKYQQASYFNPMKMFQNFHEPGPKEIIDGVMIQEPTGDAEIALALDTLFNHENTGPFICRRLIQRLVTGNPSRGYVYRVAQVFDDNGSGVRGDLEAVVKAILLDYEARSLEILDQQGYGKQREPIIRYTSLLRAFDGESQLPLSDFEPFGYNNVLPSDATRYRYYDTTNQLAQSPQNAPSVFNWFLPDYVFPGEIAQGGLVAPEFQITSETTVVASTNWKRNIIDNNNGQAVQRILGETTGISSVKIDLAPLQATLDNDGVEALVDQLDMLLLSGSMSPESRAILVDTVNSVSAGNQVKTLLYLIITSHEYTVQR